MKKLIHKYKSENWQKYKWRNSIYAKNHKNIDNINYEYIRNAQMGKYKIYQNCKSKAIIDGRNILVGRIEIIILIDEVFNGEINI